MTVNSIRPLPNLSEADILRFWEKVDIRGDDDCWPWLAGCSEPGYGSFWAFGKNWGASRVAFVLQYGGDPVGLLICHACDNPPCCNPRHVFIGTQMDNIADCVSKGRRSNGERHYNSKLTSELVLEIRAASYSGETQTALAEKYGVSQPHIERIINRKSWKHI